MLAVTEPGVKVITLEACTQLLKTTFIENVLGYFIHLDPGPMLVVQPNDKAAETFSKDRLAPMIRDTKVLRTVFGAAKARDAGDTLTHKQFAGGHVTMVGANSPTNLAMRPIRILLCDEIDKYPMSAGSEGPPIDLAKERQAEFSANSLTIEACSPTIAGHSAINASYEESDQRRAFVACPHCAEKQALEWEGVRWTKNEAGQPDLNSVAYHCVACGAAWTEAERLQALRLVWWRQTKAFQCCGEHQQAEHWDEAGRVLCKQCGTRTVSNEHAGFNASKLYAPKQSLRDLASKWARACRRGIEAKKAFWNTQLARTWKEAEDAPEWDDVFNRRSDYLSGTVPLGVVMLQAGIDGQKDRLEVSIWGFGRNRQRWLIEHRVLPGAITQPGVWRDLEAMFDETWPREGGGEMPVDQWGIDSSGFTADVYAFVRSQAGRGNVHAVDGQDRYDAAYLGVGAKDANATGKKLRRGLKTLKIGVSFCKKELVEQLTLRRPEGEAPFPPGFIHLPGDVSQEVVKQLTSEELTTVRDKSGRVRRSWNVIAGRRNEVLDCANYARGLAAMRGWERMRESQFAQIDERTKAAAAAAAAPLLPPGSVAAAPPKGAAPTRYFNRPERGFFSR
jgi:phage terminase large subunit GpA-like protein